VNFTAAATTPVRFGRLNPGVINAAVIGLGWWGRKVVADLQDSPHVRVVFGVDPSEEARDRVAALGVSTAPDFAAALADDRVEAVILCSPHRLHAEQIVAAAEAGRHVFCEKPLTTSSAEARAAIDAVTRAGVQLGIGHERRFEPAVLRLREMCRSGELGVPLVFEGNFSQDKFLDLDPGNWRLSNDEAPVGPLSATGIHLVDLAISLFGRPVEVWARLSTQATTFANGDTLTITLGFDKQQTAMITAILTTPFVGRVTVLGSEGWVEIRDRNHPEEPRGWDVTVASRGAEPETTFHPPHPTVRDNIEEFARAAAGEVAYSVPLDEMLANVQAFEAISRSAATGQVEPVG
jgi:predicted dehydrogenase